MADGRWHRRPAGSRRGTAAASGGQPAAGAGRAAWAVPGRGTAVLLHGMMSLGRTWWRVGPALAAAGWDVRALDLLAHGSSPPHDRPLSVDDLVSGVLADVTEQVDLLVGHSLGAMTAVAAVVREPGLARAVVLEDPPGGGGTDPDTLAAGVERDAATVRSDPAALARRSAADHPGWAEQDVRWDVEGVARAQVPSIAAGLRSGLRRRDLAELVAAARVPVLVLAAEPALGGVLGEPARSAVRAALPPGRFVELTGGHCLHRDLPDRWLAAVTGFADEVLPAPPTR